MPVISWLRNRAGDLYVGVTRTLHIRQLRHEETDRREIGNGEFRLAVDRRCGAGDIRELHVAAERSAIVQRAGQRALRGFAGELRIELQILVGEERIGCVLARLRARFGDASRGR